MINRKSTTNVSTLAQIELPATETPTAQTPTPTPARVTLRQQWENANAMAGRIVKERGLSSTEELFSLPNKSGDFSYRSATKSKGKVLNPIERAAVSFVAMTAKHAKLVKQLAEAKEWLAKNSEGEFKVDEITVEAFMPAPVESTTTTESK